MMMMMMMRVVVLFLRCQRRQPAWCYSYGMVMLMVDCIDMPVYQLFLKNQTQVRAEQDEQTRLTNKKLERAADPTEAIFEEYS